MFPLHTSDCGTDKSTHSPPAAAFLIYKYLAEPQKSFAINIAAAAAAASAKSYYTSQFHSHHHQNILFRNVSLLAMTPYA
jgi:hypothetical protein